MKLPITSALILTITSPFSYSTGLGFWESSASVSALAGSNGASPIDASALALNPSSIAFLEESQFTLSVNKYEVVSDYNIFGNETKYRSSDPIPSFFITGSLNENWHSGFAIYARNAADITVPSIFPIHLYEANVRPVLVSVAPSLVYSKNNFSFGTTFEYIYTEYMLSQKQCGRRRCDIFEVEGFTGGFTGGVSATWKPTDKVSLGLSYNFGASFSDENLEVELPSVAKFFTSYSIQSHWNLHVSYSYTNWDEKGILYSDYRDIFGLLTGSRNSNRYTFGSNVQLGRHHIYIGTSFDQAIDAYGGNDIRYRAGYGYHLTDKWKFDVFVVNEDYAKKENVSAGVTLVEVQNKGLGFGLGVSYKY